MRPVLPLGFLLLILLPAAFSACSSVTTLAPIGDRPATLSPSDFDGTWLSDREALFLDVADTNGLLRLSHIEAADTNREGKRPRGALRPAPVLKSDLVVVKAFRQWTFVHLRDGERPASSPWYWGLLERRSNELLIHQPNPETFSNLVARGLLPGRHQGSSVVLSNLSPDQIDRMMAQPPGLLWHSNALRLLRLSP